MHSLLSRQIRFTDWRGESVPPSPSPEQPPLAPYDPPAPAPQAAAWRRALEVVTRTAARADEHYV